MNDKTLSETDAAALYGLLAQEICEYAIFLMDVAGNITTWPPGATRVKRFSPGEALGRYFAFLYTPEARDAGLPARHLEIAARDGRFEDEGWRMRGDGSQFWAHVVLTALRDDGGRLRGYAKVTQDLTRRRADEQRMASYVNDVERLLNAVRACTMVWNLATGAVTFSPELAALLGTDAGDLPTNETVWAEMIHPDDLPLWRAAADAMRAQPHARPVLCTFRMLAASGDWQAFSCHADWSVEADEPSVLRGWLVKTSPDAGHQEEIGRLVSELQAADRRKDAFLAMLGHELRNPLAPIANAAQLIRRKAGTQTEIDSNAALIERQVRQLTRLVDDLLDVSRITHDRLSLQVDRVSIAEVVLAAIEMSRPMIEAARQRLRVELPETPMMVDGDPSRMAQVFGNLLTNAAKYSYPGGDITVTAVAQNEQCKVTVSDTGIGIDAQFLPQVFDLFVQADTTRFTHRGGMGIGLNLAQRLVHMHGGRIEAFSQGVGHGSRFTVTLPLARAPEDTPRSSVGGAALRPPPAPAPRPKALPRGLVIVADDNRDAAEALAHLLESLGFRVGVAFDGIEAVDAVRREHPDAVLLDLGMPRMDGYEAARQIRADAHGEGILLVAVTGWGQDTDRDRTRAAGFDAHLVKPVPLERLLEVLDGTAARL
jgi:PAS domain S-box-containing protein